jgi:hypothetical protein
VTLVTGRKLTAAEVEQRRAARTTHGATSEAQVRPLARNHRRRVMRQIGLRAADVDPIGRAHLESYVRLAAKVDLIDRYIEEHGMILPSGEPQPVMRLYVSLQNAARLALQRLEAHLRDGVLVDEPLAIIEAEGRRLRLAAEGER